MSPRPSPADPAFVDRGAESLLLDVPPSALEIARGAADRRKTVRLPAECDLATLLAASRD